MAAYWLSDRAINQENLWGISEQTEREIRRPDISCKIT